MPVVRLQPLAAATFFFRGLGAAVQRRNSALMKGSGSGWCWVYITQTCYVIGYIYWGWKHHLFINGDSTVIDHGFSIKHMGIWLTDDGWLMIVWGILHYTIPSLFGDDRSWAGNPILNPWSWRSNTWNWRSVSVLDPGFAFWKVIFYVELPATGSMLMNTLIRSAIFRSVWSWAVDIGVNHDSKYHFLWVSPESFNQALLIRGWNKWWLTQKNFCELENLYVW